ncbi:MAG: carboxymuconolactone decarboxylase family protein [bacterium]|nr:carboxymuconolactone decarboxylase family protein [bacterium]
MTKISQGKWTRIRPLQRDEISAYTEAGMVAGELTWGRFRNNLCKVMAYTPRLLQTEVEYCNTFIFDPPTFRGTVQEAGFLDRFIRELVISRTSLLNRSRYSVTHHSFIGYRLFADAGREAEGHRKLLHLHEVEKHPNAYTDLERIILGYTTKVTTDAHQVTDVEFEALREALRIAAAGNAERQERVSIELSRFIDSQIVELTWLIGHFCLLNRWFTVLQVPDESSADEDNFLGLYEQVVPADIRERNEKILEGGF